VKITCPHCGKEITPLLAHYMANKCPECQQPFLYLAPKQPNIMPRKDPDDMFEVYAWKSWFEPMTLEQLMKLRTTWFNQWNYYKGHELKIMRWNMRQLNRYIMEKQNAT
jgi:DNA-directed RNA polymerase subunit RPC12/RpoP